MNVIYYLIPVALIFVILGVVAFFWATKSEQFDDMEKHGLSILMDEDDAKAATPRRGKVDEEDS